MKHFNFGCKCNKNNGNLYHAIVLVIDEPRFSNMCVRYYRMGSNVMRFIQEECGGAVYSPDMDITPQLATIENATTFVESKQTRSLWLN